MKALDFRRSRAFYVLFCEQKEGTIIASDSHLRGDTMLNIYFGDMPEAVYNTSVYFNYTYEDEWLTSDFAKEVIKKLTNPMFWGLMQSKARF